MKRFDVFGRERGLRYLDFCLGGFSLAAIALHDLAHVREGRWYDVFWVCNLAAVLVAPAVLSRSPALAQVAFTWIFPGTIVWLLTAFIGDANLLPTSYGVHLGGSVVAGWAVWRARPKAKLKLWTVLGLPALAVLISRLFLPAEQNVNVAYRIPRGFSALGQTFPVFALSSFILVLLTCALGAVFCALIARLGRGSQRAQERDQR